MKSMPCILFAAIIALWALSCADDSTCDDCTDGDQAETDALDIDSLEFDFTDGDMPGDDIEDEDISDTTDPDMLDDGELSDIADVDDSNEDVEEPAESPETEEDERPLACTADDECTTGEFCNAENICETCPWPELPLTRYNYCSTPNLLVDQGMENMGAHCVMDTPPPANENTELCPAGTRCYDIPPEQRANPYYDGPWAECRTYTEPDWESGTAGEWSDSGAVALQKNGADLSCQAQQDCFDADNTGDVLMFSCTGGQCYGCTRMSVRFDNCLDINNLETNEPNAPGARRFQWSLDAYGCPVSRMVTFSCGQGSGCNWDAGQGFFGDPVACMPLE